MKVYGTYSEIMKKYLGELKPDSEIKNIVELIGSKIGLKQGLKLAKALIENYFLGNLIIDDKHICENPQKRIDSVLDLMDKISDLEEKEKKNWKEEEKILTIKKGTLLLVKHSRSGTWFGKAIEDFTTDQEWYPIASAEKRSIDGLNTQWFEGERMPCRKSLCKIEIVEEK